MKRLISKLAIVILSVFYLLPPTQIYAQSKLQGYTIDVASLNTSLSKYLTSLNFEEQLDGTYSLYINNSYVGSKSGDPMSFNYYPNSLTTIGISISPSNETVNFSFSQRQEEIYNSAFVFTLDAEGAQSLTFYPSANSTSGTETRTVKGSGGIFDFGSFSCTLGTTSLTFSVVLNANNNTATITKNGSSSTYSVSKTTTTRTLYFENFVEGHPLNMNYMEKNLAKQTFANAKTIDYSDSDIDAAVQNESLTLINSTTNKTYSVPLRRTITYWNRVSGGEWGTGTYGEYGGEIQVVCEWYDSACSSIRAKYGEDGRLFAVYGASATYPTVTSYTDTKLEYPTLYHNVRWPSDWTSASMSSSVNEALSSDYGIVQYRAQSRSWSEWTAWTSDYNTLAFNGTSSTVKGEQKEFYKYRTYTWSDVGGWSTNATVCSYISSTDGRAQSKSATDEACGVNQYNYCANKNAGCKTYNSCTSGSCGYATCRSSGCGCETYSSCRDSSCGTESYQSSSSGCAKYNSKTCYKNCNAHSCNCRTVVDRQYSCNCSSYSCNCKTSSYSCNCKQVCNRYTGSGQCVSYTQSCSTCQSTSCSTCQSCQTCSVTHQECSTCYDSCPYDCSYTTYDAPCYDTRNKSCRAAACGCDTYKSCAHQGCGYATCVTEACGCGTWNSSRDASCGVESYKTCTLYKCQIKDFSDWVGPKDTCPYLSGVDVECKSDGYRYRYSNLILGDWSGWFNTSNFWANTAEVQYQHRYKLGTESWDKEKGTSSSLGTNVYYTGESKKSTTAQYVTDTFAKTSTVTIGSLAEMTAAQIAAKTEEIKQALMLYNAYNTIKSDDGYTLYQDVVDYKNANSKIASQAQEQALDYFERKTIFIPYMYITSHNRAVSAPGEVSGYDNETLTSVTTSEITKTASQGMKLIPYDIDLTKDTKIIYYDYRDPLINYHDELPENWQGYEELIGELQHSDLTNYKIEVELSRDDLQAMKDYLKTHNYESNDCEMLREFSYIFKTTDSDLAKFLATGKGCKIEGD